MDINSLIALIFAALILFSILVVIRQHNRKQQKDNLDSEFEEGNFPEIELAQVENPTQQDKQAYELIEAERQKVLTSLSLQTSISPRKTWQMSFDLIKEIATIYYPDIENPQYQASFSDLLMLNERIVKRVQEYLEYFPLNTIKDLNIKDVLTYKKRYENYSQSAIFEFTKKHKYLYSIGKHAWMGYNALNPWYWGRRALTKTGKEATYRYLLNKILTIVGEEAVKIYSKRDVRKEAVIVEKNIAFEMINMALVDKVVSSKEYEVILNFILSNNKFDDGVKITLLKTLQRKCSLKTDMPVATYNEKEKKRLLAKVEKVAKADKQDTLKKSEALKALKESLELISG